MYKYPNIKIKVQEADNPTKELKKINSYLTNKLRLQNKVKDLNIVKKSIDARDKNQLYYIYTVEFNYSGKIDGKIKNKLQISKPYEYNQVESGNENLQERIVIVGSGPCGLMAATVLAKRGYRPIVLERGDAVSKRDEKINRFWKDGILDQESNVQFGLGGAGTFSDGKLTTGIKDSRCKMVLEEFVKNGAPKEILYSNLPHIGTDILKNMVTNMAENIENNGGEIRFNSKLTDIVIENNKVVKIQINNEEYINCQALVLAIGHSARDTFDLIKERNIPLELKNFAVGVRIEHPQSMINSCQYGKFATGYNMPQASYKLTHHCSNSRGVYTFCMCPGGYVVAASSENNTVVTNGMSYFARNGENANSALLVQVGEEDYEKFGKISSVEFQKDLEKRAFILGGSDYKAPVQKVGDFLNDKVSTGLGNVKPTYPLGHKFIDFRELFSQEIIQSLKEGLIGFNRKIKGFAMDDAIMTAVESRSSSPVRILRDENFESKVKGIFPSGEGCGYAGGIMSSAVDGIKVAEEIISRYKS